VPGLAAVAVLMITYGGFLFSFALHLQAGLGDSALRAGLTFAPCAVVQLGQAVGVAMFGSLFLTLDSAPGPTVSGRALAVTFSWLAAAMVLAVAAGIPLARTVAAAGGRPG
jgi:ABC-type sugar transport system permease subunit